MRLFRHSAMLVKVRDVDGKRFAEEEAVASGPRLAETRLLAR